MSWGKWDNEEKGHHIQNVNVNVMAMQNMGNGGREPSGYVVTIFVAILF